MTDRLKIVLVKIVLVGAREPRVRIVLRGGEPPPPSATCCSAMRSATAV